MEHEHDLCPYGIPQELTLPTLRRGKWTPEEEVFADQIREYFSQGYLNLAHGTTLRTYLSNVLHCDPMRITKKFTKEESVGKQMFVARENTGENLRRVDSALAVLQNYRDRWYAKLLLAERLNLRKETMPARDYKSFVHLSKDMEELHRNEHKVKRLLDQLLNEDEKTRVLQWMRRAHGVLQSSEGGGCSVSSNSSRSGDIADLADPADASDDESVSVASIFVEGSSILPEVHAHIVEAFRDSGSHGSSSSCGSSSSRALHQMGIVQALTEEHRGGGRRGLVTSGSDASLITTGTEGAGLEMDDLGDMMDGGSASLSLALKSWNGPSPTTFSHLQSTKNTRSKKHGRSGSSDRTQDTGVDLETFLRKRARMKQTLPGSTQGGVDLPDMTTDSAVEALLGLTQ